MTAILEKIAFMPTFIIEPIDCMTMLGMPTRYISRTVSPQRRKFLKLIFTSCSLKNTSANAISIPTHCPITVAYAAPATPISGKGPIPKIIRGSRMILTTAPTS